MGACIPDDLRAAYVNESDRIGAMLGLDDVRTLAGAHLPAALPACRAWAVNTRACGCL